MSSASANPIQPSLVGNAFVKQYYHLLSKTPEMLHRFYKDPSHFTHNSDEAVSGQKNINDRILSLGLKNAEVNLEHGSIISQMSLNDGVLVMVTGTISLQHEQEKNRPFTQTFFLATQPNGYFVLNDSFRYLDMKLIHQDKAPKPSKKQPQEKQEPVVSTVSSPRTAVPKEAAPAESIATTPQDEDGCAKKVITASTGNNARPETVCVEKEEELVQSPARPTSPASPRPTSVMQNQKQAPNDDSDTSAQQPKSWASLFVSASTGLAPTIATSSANIASLSTDNNKQQLNNNTKSSVKNNSTNKPFNSTSLKGTDKELPSPSRYYSLYVRDVPSQTKESDLRELFNEFGTIANVNVIGGKNYAFIDYTTIEGMKAAIANGKEYKLFDKVIHIEERSEKKDTGRGFRSDNNRMNRDRNNNSSRGGRGGGNKNSNGGANKDRQNFNSNNASSSRRGERSSKTKTVSRNSKN